MGKGRQVVKPTGGPEHGGDQRQCHGCFPLWGRGQVKQGCPRSGLHWPQALPGVAVSGPEGQTLAAHPPGGSAPVSLLQAA